MTDFELALEQALELQARGVPLDDLLARDPHHAADLRPLLEAAQVARLGLMKDAPLPTPDLRRGRERFLRTARQTPPLARESTPALPILRAAAALALVVILVTLAAVGLVSASESALPGDSLYPAKLAFEQIGLALTVDPAARASMQARLDALRRAEALAAAAQGRQVPVAFEGVVERVDPGVVIVSGVAVRVDGTAYRPGDRVHVEARTLDGQIIADRIRITFSPTVTPAGTGVRQNDPTASHTAAPTRPVDPSPTPSSTPVRPEPSRTRVPADTPTPASRPIDSRPTPTATPVDLNVPPPAAGRPTEPPPRRP